MKKKLLKLLPYIIVLGLIFYLCPICLEFERDNLKYKDAVIVFEICILPIITFTSGLIYGICNGFGIIFPIVTFILIFPTKFIYWFLQEWSFSIFFAIIACFGVAIGEIFRVLFGILICKIFYRKNKK